MEKVKRKTICDECINRCKKNKKIIKLGKAYLCCSGFNKGNHGYDDL